MAFFRLTMATLPNPQRRYTFAEYLDTEELAEYKSEFFNGEIYAMAGGTPTHARLSARMCGLLDRLLPAFQVYDSNLKLYIEQDNRGVYPDVMALCGGQPQYWNKRRDVILNPTIVVEVLSPSTQKYDKEEKLFYYRSVATLQNILLVAQDIRLVDHFSRQDAASWIVTRHLEGLISLQGIAVSLDDIYLNIL